MSAAALALVLLIAWEAAVRIGLLSAVFFPAPTTVASAFAALLRSGRLATTLGFTVGRLLAAFCLGALPALALGMLMGWSPGVRNVADPFVAALHPVPKTALLPLLIVLLGLGEASKVTTAALAAFFPVLINAMAGVAHISPVHFEVARNFRAGRLKVLTRVVLPGSLPMVLTGVRLGFNSALVVTIAVELIYARRGVGAMIWQAWETMRIEELYVGIAMAALLGMAFSSLLRHAARRLAPWHRERRV